MKSLNLILMGAVLICTAMTSSCSKENQEIIDYVDNKGIYESKIKSLTWVDTMYESEYHESILYLFDTLYGDFAKAYTAEDLIKNMKQENGFRGEDDYYERVVSDTENYRSSWLSDLRKSQSMGEKVLEDFENASMYDKAYLYLWYHTRLFEFTQNKLYYKIKPLKDEITMFGPRYMEAKSFLKDSTDRILKMSAMVTFKENNLKDTLHFDKDFELLNI